jgi:hypothetical protein
MSSNSPATSTSGCSLAAERALSHAGDYSMVGASVQYH